MTVRDLMNTDFQAAEESETLLDAARRMLGHGVNSLPILDRQGTLIGVLEIEDLLPKLEPVPFSEDVEALRLFGAWVDEKNLNSFCAQYCEKRVSELMHADPSILEPDDDLSTVLREMRETAFRPIFVVDAGRRLLGMITRSDMLELLLGDES